MKHFFPSAARAARTAVQLAASPEVEGVSGAYFKYGTRRRPRLSSGDPDLGCKLWAISARMTGLTEYMDGPSSQ
jgi:hypothetical protein